MTLDYQSKKWLKEVDKMKKFLKEIGGDYTKNEKEFIRRFIESPERDYLSFYNCLYGTYESYARYSYLYESNNNIIINYIYLSGLALMCVKQMHDIGIRTKYNFTIENNLYNFDYALYELISVNETGFSEFNKDDNIITLIYNNRYDEARQLLDKLPDDVDESKEVYYVRLVFLKKIYLAIINHNEKAFNNELKKRIEKYRKNMVGYSTIIDVVSIALIKMAKLAGIECTIDVIEIPKMFFEGTYVIDKDIVKLPFYDEFLKLDLKK